MESADDRASDRIPDSASDADSDLEELQGDIAKFDESVREFLASHRGTSAGGREAQSTIRGRGARGPRKAAKPRGDITARLSKVNQAFLSGDYDRALDIAFEVIRINAETYQAWTALSSIFRERGELDRSLSAMVYAAHLRPKDVSGWLRCASFALDSIIDGESTNLHTARLCFSAALRADRTNIEARVGKAGICHRQGHLSTAITEYKYVLKRHPYDLGIIRKLAEACLDGINAASAIPSAVSAYKQYFDRIVDHQDKQDDTLWHDIGVYIELIASLGRYQEAIFELKRLSRLLSGRLSESYWDDWRIDDREWDTFEERRSSVPGYNARGDSPSRLGLLLPLDLRIRLATYRLKLGDQQEALNHLDLFNSDEMTTEALAKDFPFLIFDLGVELSRGCLPELAIRYFELLRNLPGEPDAAVLLQIGRCHLASAEQAKAEELFLAALEVDEDNIDARIELANMYETAREDEEALILAAEALALREAQDQSAEDGFDKEPRHARTSIGLIPRTSRRDARVNTADRPAMVGSVTRRPMIPRRYRPKRLAGPDKRRQEEQTRAFKLSQQYSIVRDLKQQISAGHNELIPAWMASSKELIDDFRSLKRFYSWDKYLHFLGSKGLSQEGGSAVPGTELSQMYERLSRSIAPQTEQGHQLDTLDAATHQGITFDDWLDLFLEYAIGLAILHRRQEAYQVCAAAKDSTVFQSTKHDFTIYVAWSVCAIYTNDEERCVAIARHLMRDGGSSDSYRMFAFVSVLCQSPVSWYTSGPAQKYILRQIKAIDASHETASIQRGGTRENERANAHGLDIDICLLMLYGHILFTSTSYSFALGYFLRARSLDPSNAMVNLSLGLAYVHYGLKRQSTNRQYLMLQGQAFLSQYARQRPNDVSSFSMAERYYNMGRLFQLLGISYLSSGCYAQALDLCKNEVRSSDLPSLIIANTVISLLTVGNIDVAFSVLKGNLKL